MPEPKSPSASDRIEAREVAAEPARIVTVRPPAETVTRQHLPYFVGISRGTAGATGVSMHMVVIPPGAAAKPHLHHGYETAIYLLEGRVETRYGPGLAQSVFQPGWRLHFHPGRCAAPADQPEHNRPSAGHRRAQRSQRTGERRTVRGTPGRLSRRTSDCPWTAWNCLSPVPSGRGHPI